MFNKKDKKDEEKKDKKDKKTKKEDKKDPGKKQNSSASASEDGKGKMQSSLASMYPRLMTLPSIFLKNYKTTNSLRKVILHF